MILILGFYVAADFLYFMIIFNIIVAVEIIAIFILFVF